MGALIPTRLPYGRYKACLSTVESAFGSETDYAQLQKMYGADPVAKQTQRTTQM
jgi:hypothetical protein